MIAKEEIKSVVDGAKYSISSVETLLNQGVHLEIALDDFSKEINESENRLKFLSVTKEYYLKAVDKIYCESIGALKETLNTALRYIITDKNYSCNITLEDKRGTKNLYISIVDNDDNTEVDAKNGCGNGIRTILSMILRFFYLLNQSKKVNGNDVNIIAFFDEKFSALSSQYVPAFFEVLQKMCDENNIAICLITHDERFIPYADKTYIVSDGEIQEMPKGRTEETFVLGKEENRKENFDQ